MHHLRDRIGPAVLLCATVLELSACGGDKPAEETNPKLGRGLRPEVGVVQEAAPAVAPTARPSQLPGTQAPAAAPAAKPAEEAAAADEPPARDYAGELKTLVGSPSGCLKPRPAAKAPREINVAVEAIVMESGMISRAYARSNELDDEELACVRARLQSARMQPAVEEAPRSVTTTISLVQQPGAAAAAPSSAAAPSAAAAAAAPAAAPPPPGDHPPQAPSNYDEPEAPPDLDQPETPSDVDQPETTLPALGTPVNP